MTKPKVLFVCNHNAGRSQMAEAYLNARYGDRYEAYSAGNNPSRSMNEYTLRVMAEAGIRMDGHAPKPLDGFMADHFAVAARLCTCADVCPRLPPSDRVIDQLFPDPSEFYGSEEEILRGFREVRDLVFAWVDETFGDAEGEDGILVITWRRPGMPVPPAMICSDTGRSLQEAFAGIAGMLEAQDVACRVEEEEGPMAILFNGTPFEEIVPIYVPKTCSLCGSCEGSAAECTGERRYEGIPESVLRLAARRAAGL
jgi:arsenate reductase